MDANDRRNRRDARQQVKPGPRRREPTGRPVWQTALIGLAVLVGVFLVAFIVTGEGPEEATETAAVGIDGDPLPPIPQDASAPDPATGQPAPQAASQDFQGEPVELLDEDGGTIVVFLAHWCPVCQREVPVIVDHLGGSLPDGVDVVGVPTSTDRSQGNYPPSAWLRAEDWEFEVLLDSSDNELAQAYGVQAFPSFVAVGPDGNVQARGSGELGPDALDQLVSAAQGEG